MRSILPVVLLVALASGRAPAGETKPPPAGLVQVHIKGALESIVRQVIHGPRVRGPSLTHLVAGILSADPRILVPCLRRLWNERDDLRWDAARGLEQTVLFLYGLDRRGRPFAPGRPKSDGLWDCDGAVLLRIDLDSDRLAGPFLGVDLPCFDTEFAQRSLRPPHPDAHHLLALLESGSTRDWRETERITLATALGEAARDAPDVRNQLLIRFDGHPRSRELAVALGWSDDPTAAKSLLRRFLALAHSGSYGCLPEMKELGRCLARSDPAFLRAKVDALRGDLREFAMLAVAGESLAPALLRAAVEARNERTRARVIRQLARTLAESSGDFSEPAGEMLDTVAAIRSLLDGAEGPERSDLRKIAEWIFYAGNRYPIQGSFAEYDSAKRFRPPRTRHRTTAGSRSMLPALLPATSPRSPKV